MGDASDPVRSRAWRDGALWLTAVAGIGLLMFTYKHLDAVVNGDDRPILDSFLSEMTAALAAGLLFFPVAFFVRRLPLERGRWLGRLPLYGLVLLLFAGAHTSLMWLSRSVLFPVAGLGPYDYGKMPLRYLMELPAQALIFGAMAGLVSMAEHRRRGREREMGAARLEASLARAEVRNLRLQLQPHFLFNTLNTISATMYEDPAAADEMLDRLAELLRVSLRTAEADEIELREELRHLELYLELMRARFGDRLDVRVAVEPGAEASKIPPMTLQPLVENAIRHGGAETRGRGCIEVRARVERDRLVIEVDDDGPGAPGSEPLAAAGVGLGAVAERIRLLYGAAGSFAAGDGGAGFLVRLEVPLA